MRKGFRTVGQKMMRRPVEARSEEGMKGSWKSSSGSIILLDIRHSLSLTTEVSDQGFYFTECI